jgi:LAO/AO transport system kinase
MKNNARRLAKAKKQSKSEAMALLKDAKKGSTMALAKLLSFVETDLASSLQLLSKISTSSNSMIKLGITGPPGAGKSTLITLLIQYYRSQKKRIAVIAVDPSSPFSGGALLGDRIRMNRFASDKNVFIRSIGSRGALGGLSAATGAMARVFGLCDYDVLIIETVGVGQTELNVMNLSDITAVVLVPESGDVIQTLKAGILEIADAFIVNKSDRPGAELLSRELESLVEQEGLGKRPVFLTSAVSDSGVKELAQKLIELAKIFRKEKTRIAFKAKGELRALIISAVDQSLQGKLADMKVSDVFKAFGKIEIPVIDLSKLKKP